jgi:hypothetical protein
LTLWLWSMMGTRRQSLLRLLQAHPSLRLKLRLRLEEVQAMLLPLPRQLPRLPPQPAQ